MKPFRYQGCTHFYVQDLSVSKNTPYSTVFVFLGLSRGSFPKCRPANRSGRGELQVISNVWNLRVHTVAWYRGDESTAPHQSLQFQPLH